MSKILIAYNNAFGTVLCDFIESCADMAKQICIDNGITYSSVFPPNLNENNVGTMMPDHKLCVIVGHGDEDGIYNECDEAVVSTHTTNYNFNGKGFYSVSCCCAQNLYPHLKTMGILFFVGYIEELWIRGDRTPFVISVMAGLKSFMSGDNIQTAKKKMLETFDEQIDILDKTNPWASKDLLHDREALIFEGSDFLSFSDLH